MNSFPKKILVTFGALALVLFGLVGVFLFNANEEVYDRTSDWEFYYEETVSNFFYIPPEAIIKQATQVKSAIMGGSFTVEFSLPEDNTPEQWLDQIAKASGINPNYKKGVYAYDCENECDLSRLTYIPEKQIYIASAGWD